MGIELYKNHYLRLSAISSMTDLSVVFRAIVRRGDGHLVPVEHVMRMPTAYATVTDFVHLTPGELISVVAYQISQPAHRGRTFVRVSLDDGFGNAASFQQLLVQNYLTEANWLTWPGSQMVSSEEGLGWRTSMGPANPPIGTDYVNILPANRRRRYITAGVRLVTAPAGPNRLMQLQITQFGQLVLNRGAQAVQAGGLTVDYRYYFGGAFRQVAAETEEQSGPDVILYPTEQLGLIVANLQAMDQLSNIVLNFEEWLLL